MTALTLADLQNTPPLKAHSVPVPEFGPDKEVFVAELSAMEQEVRLGQWWINEQKRRGDDTNVGLRAFAVAACLCSDQRRIFLCADEKAVQSAAETLGNTDTKPVARMFAKVQDVNGLVDEDELEKKLPTKTSGIGSERPPTDSPAPGSGSSS